MSLDLILEVASPLWERHCLANYVPWSAKMDLRMRRILDFERSRNQRQGPEFF